MDFGKNLFRKSINLVLFDCAGEDVKDQDVLHIYLDYIIHAAGLIFLIDPQSFSKAGAQPYGASGPGQTRPEQVVENVFNNFDRARKGLRFGKVTVPAAFVLTKIDAMSSAIDPGSVLRRPSNHDGGVDAEDLNRISEEVTSYIAAWRGDHLLNLAEQKFARPAFFGISSLGSPPQGNAVSSIAPFRVADPLLWILTQLGYVPEKGKTGPWQRLRRLGLTRLGLMAVVLILVLFVAGSLICSNKKEDRKRTIPFSSTARRAPEKNGVLKDGLSAFRSENYKTAVERFRHLGGEDSIAQYYLGVIYEQGLGVSADCDTATKWYRKAAEGGNGDAQFALGRIIDRGKCERASGSAGSDFVAMQRR
ncbi:MAG: sel1 repeat family protein [Deltaproteobacteria bacterium]|nr:sel1 repeat family protein [Deltaproteobacteria bacterium]